MKYEHFNEIKGIIILALGLILLASLVSFVPEDLPWYTSQPNIPAQNWIRISGAYIAGGLFFVSGYSAYFIVVFLLFWAWNKLTNREIHFSAAKFISFCVLYAVISALFSLTGSELTTDRFQRAGIIGLISADFLVKYFGVTGAYIILVALGALALILTGEFLVSPIFIKLTALANEFIASVVEKIHALRSGLPLTGPKEEKIAKPNRIKPFLKEKPRGKGDEDIDDAADIIKKKFEKLDKRQQENPLPKVAPKPEPSIKIIEPKPKEKAEKSEMPPAEQKPPAPGVYHLPSLDLLNDSPVVSNNNVQDILMNGARTLEATLSDFGVSVRVADIERGPVITRYELQPAPGVKVQKIVSLSDDIALAMRASSVRIVAPIPGKDRVGIEVPNGSSAAVFLKDVLSQSKFKAGAKLNLAIGKDITGESLIADLAEMPHLLVAGTTGSGKTVCLNNLVMSLLFSYSPEELKFVMVDPKMVELVQYNDIPHALCPTITDPKKVSAALNWLVTEMENRYKMLASAGVRNIKGYNEKGNKMPYIVLVVDELADLMQVSAKTIESSIARLAQLARAVGIHLILATQRPSVDVITGVIKANFSARISFKVASKVDSRTVLDTNGAQDLLGKGDLLFMRPGDPKPIRGQCCYVSDEEIHRVIEFVKAQGNPTYDETVTKQQSSAAGGASGEKDEMYDEAVKVVIETNQASVSILQRKLRLGYTRAARLIDIMEQEGIVGPYVGSKPRDILVDREKWLLDNMGTESNGQ